MQNAWEVVQKRARVANLKKQRIQKIFGFSGLAALGGSWGRSWRLCTLLGAILAALGASLGPPGAQLAPPGAALACFGGSWAPSGRVSGAFWACFGGSQALSGAVFGPPRPPPGFEERSENLGLRRSVPRRLAAMLGATLLGDAQLEISTATDSRSIQLFN